MIASSTIGFGGRSWEVGVGQIFRAWVATFVILLVAYVAQQVVINVYDLTGSSRWLAGAACLLVAVAAMGVVARRQART